MPIKNKTPHTFQEMTAPYNFVPLSGWVFEPDWAHQVSHDVPFSNGLSGRLDIAITAETPLLVGGKQTKATEQAAGEVRFFQLPDKRYAIPGTSLKGMIRNVLEIASFGKMQFVDDRRLSLRDISGRTVIGDNYKIEGQQAGFLRLREDSSVEIIPCEYIHISHRDIEYLLEWQLPPYIFTKAETPTVRQKYARWHQRWQKINSEPLSEDTLPTISFNIESQSTPQMARDLDKGQQKGTLVFTGQISDKGQTDSGKYRDFVFYDRQDKRALPVSPQVFKDFLYNHGDEDKNSTNSWRTFWRDRLFKNQHHEIPVFYHLDEHEEVRSIGLAYMYRLAYHYSIGETIDYTNNKHRQTTGYDLADLLFGKAHADDQQSQESLKSRVSFGAATLTGVPQFAHPCFSEATILNGPKPTYFPNYIKQDDVQEVVNNNAPYKLGEGKQYRTYMQPDSEIRGWKRYPVRRWEAMQLSKPAAKFRGKAKENKKTQVKLFPLKEGVQFKTSIRFHNLLPAELGALIWTMTWGNDDKFRHSLGMGKPFGFGQVQIKITSSDIRSIKAPDTPIAFDEKQYVSWFRQLMEKEYTQAKQAQIDGKWGDSEQIRQLKAMADPKHRDATAEKLKYLKLEDDKGQNEFVKAKQQGWVLPEYGYKRYFQRDQLLFPRKARKPKPKPIEKTVLAAAPIENNLDGANQWLEAAIRELQSQLPPTSEALFSKPLAQKWQNIENADLKNLVRTEISQGWTNHIPDQDVDWWKVPPSKPMARIKKIYLQG